MKYKFKQPSDFWETYVAVQKEWPWMKGQLYLWCCLIRFNISCKYYDFHLNSDRNMNILKIFQYKYIRNQTGIAVKRSRSTKIHHLCKPGRAHIPNATKQVPRPLVFWFQRRRSLRTHHGKDPWSTWYQGRYFETCISTSKTVSLSFQDSRVSFKDWAYGI